jgi:hypothetical protein
LELSTFQEWREAFFSLEDLADPAVSGALADPDGDRLVNVREYVMYLHPTFANPDPISFSVIRNEPAIPLAVTLSFPWADGMTDATIKLVGSAELKNWQPLPYNIVEIPNLGPHKLLTLRAEVLGREAYFVQLIVMLTPAIVEP